MKQYRKRKKHEAKIIIVLLLVTFIYVAENKNIGNLDITVPSLESVFHHVASEENSWKLILVNRNNYIPDGYVVELTELSNGEKVDSRIYPELQEMFNAARAEELSLFVAAGYRTEEKQQQLLDEKIEAYKNEGYTKSEAKKLAELLNISDLQMSYITLDYFLQYCKTESGQENRSVGACCQVHLSKCRQHIFRKP